MLLNAAEWLGGKNETPLPRRSVRAEAGSSLVADLVANKFLSAVAPKPGEEAKAEAADEKKDTTLTPFDVAQGRLDTNPSLATPKPSEGGTLTRQGDYHVLRLGQREYRVGGLDKNNSLEVLKVAVRLLVRRSPDSPRGRDEDGRHGDENLFHLDSFDMARDGERRRFIERAAEETRLEKDLVKRDLGKLLLALEQAQSERITAALTPDPRHLTPT